MNVESFYIYYEENVVAHFWYTGKYCMKRYVVNGKPERRATRISEKEFINRFEEYMNY